MTVFLAIETSQPCGTKFRLALGCTIPILLVSGITAIARLF